MYIGIKPPFRVNEGHHVTLAFLGHKGESGKVPYLRAVQAVAAATERFHMNGNGRIEMVFEDVGCFQPKWCWHSRVSSPRGKLARYQGYLIEELDRLGVYNSKDFPVFVPHLTLGYGDELGYLRKDVINPYEGMRFLVEEISVVCNSLGTTDIKV